MACTLGRLGGPDARPVTVPFAQSFILPTLLNITISKAYCVVLTAAVAQVAVAQAAQAAGGRYRSDGFRSLTDGLRACCILLPMDDMQLWP